MSGVPGANVITSTMRFAGMWKNTTDNTSELVFSVDDFAEYLAHQTYLGAGRFIVTDPDYAGTAAITLGVVDARAAFVAAQAACGTAGTVIVPPGTYRIASSLTLTSAVALMPGAILKPASGATITFSGDLAAGLYRCFDTSLGGVIAFATSILVRPNWFATGRGTDADPFTGWDTAVPWAARTAYQFENGVYSYATAPNWNLAGIRILGRSSIGTVLKFTGTGPCVRSDAGSGASGGTYNFWLQNVLIKGNALATVGVYLRNCHHSHLEDVSVVDVTTAGLSTDFCIVGFCKNFTVDVNEAQSTFQPVDGILLDGQGGTGPTNAWVIINPVVTSCTGWGLRLELAQANTIVGGDSESNTSGNLKLGATSRANSFYGLYSNGNINDAGSWNHFHNLANGGTFTLAGGNAKVVGGQHGSIVVTGQDNIFSDMMYGYGTGTFTDSGTRTIIQRVQKYGVSAVTYQTEGFPLSIAKDATTTLTIADYADVRITDKSISGDTAFIVVTGGTPFIQYQTQIGAATTYTLIAGSGGKINVTYAAGVLSIQNKQASGINVFVDFRIR